MELKMNQWYEDYTQEKFINLISKFPLVPFFVDGSSMFVSGVTYRWNNGKLESKQNNEWKEGSLTDAVEEDATVNFIIFYSTCMLELVESGEYEVLLKSK
ncbi:hypothetical protein [Aneurinibacillus aneurinilyticus]|uniref:hypothetical protein n=1 Tax=Aneurinibacillus aneurinilyticus TaxID=1391 RepID=UPI0035238B6B